MDVNQPVADRQAACFDLLDAKLRQALRDLLEKTDLAPYSSDPLALQDDALNRLLGYFRRLATSGKLAALRLDSFDSYGVTTLSGSRSAPSEQLPGFRFESLAAVCDFILKEHIRQYLTGNGAETAR